MSVALVRLDAGQLEDLAELLAEKLPKGPPMSPLVGVAEVAAYLRRCLLGLRPRGRARRPPSRLGSEGGARL